MPSARRFKAVTVTVVLTILVLFYYTSGASNTRNAPFYLTTQSGLSQKHTSDKIAAAESVDTFKKLDEADVKAQEGSVDHPNDLVREAVLAKLEAEKAPEPVADVVSAAKEGRKKASGPPYKEIPLGPMDDEEGEEDEEEEEAVYPDGEFTDNDEEISVAGRKTMKVDKSKGKSSSSTKELTPEEEEAAKEKAKAEAELNDILKRSPIIIFSKTYCPYSRKAKSILLDKYRFIPAPFVVELDQHELGPTLQAVLAENTGRKTVPNVLVNGKSIGGGDDVAKLDADDELITQVRILGGKRVLESGLREKVDV